MEKKRVVITGMGSLTSLGPNVPAMWDALMHCESGIEHHEDLDVEGMRVTIAGRVKGYEATDHFPAKDLKKMDPFIQYGLVAAREAVAMSGLDLANDSSLNAERCGVALGSGIGGLTLLENNIQAAFNQSPRRISPFFIPGTIINLAAGLASIEHGFKGPNVSVVTACSTGAHNMGLAMRAIQYGDADVMLAGGCEHASTVAGIGGFAAMKALSTRNDDPHAASRPWDTERDGFVLSDGAGAVVLESLEHAERRGATILAELEGFGYTGDAFHMTQPDQTAEGPARCLTMALRDAGCAPADIHYVNAHGTSTPLNDAMETKALHRVFGDDAQRLAISSTKSMHGHMLGAAGAVEAVISVLALQHQLAPSTLNLTTPSEGCDLDYMPGEPRAMAIERVLSNSFGFGGTNATLLFKRWPAQ